MPNVNIANRLAQALTVYVLHKGVPVEMAVPPYGFVGPIARSDILAHTLSLVASGYLALQDLPELPVAPDTTSTDLPVVL